MWHVRGEQYEYYCYDGINNFLLGYFKNNSERRSLPVLLPVPRMRGWLGCLTYQLIVEWYGAVYDYHTLIRKYPKEFLKESFPV